MEQEIIGREYTEELWDNRVFGSEDVMEALRTKTLFGELDHPDGDRCETLAKNAAITITKLEKRPEEGVIYGEAEILDTPTGRIVKALVDSGAQLGISSRGMGEEIYVEGRNIIDPETYDFITFDVVVTPANTKARVSLTESKHISKLTENLKKEITESETENQLNQIKTVVETIETENKAELLEMIDNKLNPEEEVVVEEENTVQKVEESVYEKEIQELKEKLEEQMNIVKETSKALEQLTNENKKLVIENAIKDNKVKGLKEKLINHTGNLKKLNETLKVQEDKINELEGNVEDLNKQLKESVKTEITIDKMKRMNELKVERLNKVNNKKIEEVEKTNRDLLDENEKLTNKYNNLMESNKKLMQSVSDNTTNNNNLLEENKQLKAKVLELENKQKEQAKKLTESKVQEENTIAKLEAQVKELTESKAKMEEANQNFARLSFNPIGTVKAVAENFKSDEYSDEDLALYNMLINN